ncbi:MAG: hypothetical protein ACRC8S_22300 [Fimbriiglobus sp.]
MENRQPIPWPQIWWTNWYMRLAVGWAIGTILRLVFGVIYFPVLFQILIRPTLFPPWLNWLYVNVLFWGLMTANHAFPVAGAMAAAMARPTTKRALYRVILLGILASVLVSLAFGYFGYQLFAKQLKWCWDCDSRGPYLIGIISGLFAGSIVGQLSRRQWRRHDEDDEG